MNVSTEFWIQIFVYVIGGFTFVGINAFIVGRFIAKLATKEELEKAKAEGDEKRRRIYERVDEHKRFIDEQCVRKDLCASKHDNVAEAFRSLMFEIKGLRAELISIIKENRDHHGKRD